MAGAGFDPAAALEELDGSLARAAEMLEKGRVSHRPGDHLRASAALLDAARATRRLVEGISLHAGLVSSGDDETLVIGAVDPRKASDEMRVVHAFGRRQCEQQIEEARAAGTALRDLVAPDPPADVGARSLAETWYRGWCERMDEEIRRGEPEFEVGEQVTIARGPLARGPLAPHAPTDGVVVEPLVRGHVHVKTSTGTYAIAPSDLDHGPPPRPALRSFRREGWEKQGRRDASEAMERWATDGGSLPVPVLVEAAGLPADREAYTRAFGEVVRSLALDELLRLILDVMPAATNRDLAADGPAGDSEGRVWDRIEAVARAISEARGG